MKTIILIIVLILIPFSCPKAQHLFPLHVGDKWSYWVYPNSYPEYSIVSDTVMSNGKRYFEMLENHSFIEFYRQEGDSVFLFDTILKKEYLEFDFSASVGDTISNIQRFSERDKQVITLISKGINEIFNVKRSSYTFWLQYPGLTDGSYSITITDSLGITYFAGEGGAQYLGGAIINNIQFGNLVDVKIPAEIPSNFYLSQNYPNPFNPTTSIKFSIPRYSFVSLNVYDILGREIASLVNEEKSPGVYIVKFDGSTLTSGIYFYQLKAGNYTETKKFILIK
jgi:hypothetical protein